MSQHPGGGACDQRGRHAEGMQVKEIYSPAKNSATEARAKAKAGAPTHSPTTAEFDIYGAHAASLRRLGCHIDEPQKSEFNGLSVDVGAQIVLAPSFAASTTALHVCSPADSAACSALLPCLPQLAMWCNASFWSVIPPSRLQHSGMPAAHSVRSAAAAHACRSASRIQRACASQCDPASSCAGASRLIAWMWTGLSTSAWHRVPPCTSSGWSCATRAGHWCEAELTKSGADLGTFHLGRTYVPAHGQGFACMLAAHQLHSTSAGNVSDVLQAMLSMSVKAACITLLHSLRRSSTIAMLAESSE
jgi:hypothetical protein